MAKDQLFYDRYRYCFSFQLAEANVLRGLKHDLIDTRLNQRIEWREVARKRWAKSLENTYWNIITDEVRANLHTICDTIIDCGDDCKIAVSHHHAYLYTNNIALIDYLRTFRCLSQMKYTQAVVNRPKNTIRLKTSQYANRSYFCYTKLTQKEKTNIQNLVANNHEHIRVSPSLHQFLNEKPYLRTMDHYFIDYNDEQFLTLLALVRPGLIRKTLQIVTK